MVGEKVQTGPFHILIQRDQPPRQTNPLPPGTVSLRVHSFLVIMKRLFLLVLLSGSFHATFSQTQITYVANEGVLIETEGKKVMIDALFDKFYDQYLFPDEALRNNMISGQSPFDQVDLLLTTHMHRDHFEALVTGNFLNAHQESELLSSEQIKNILAEKYSQFSAIAKRVNAHERTVETSTDEINGIIVHSFFIHHAGGARTADIENMGFVIELEGKRILHVGDADMDLERFSELNLAQFNIDLALIPYWYMMDEAGRQIINEQIKADQLVGIHFPISPSKLALQEIAAHYPEARVFKKAFESIRLD